MRQSFLEGTPVTNRRFGQSTGRVKRVLHMIVAIQSGKITVDDLAQLFDVSRRTIFRDLAALSYAGFHYKPNGTTGAYELTAYTSFQDTNLSSTAQSAEFPWRVSYALTNGCAHRRRLVVHAVAALRSAHADPY